MKKILLLSLCLHGYAHAALSVTTTLPKEMRIPEQVPIQGVVVATHQALIKPEMSNLQVLSVHKDVGDTVKKGETLITLNATTLQNELMKAKTSEAEARIAYEKAKSEWDRVQQLSEGNALSIESKKNYEFSMKSALARWMSSQVSVKQAHINVNKAVVKAPFSGIIQERNIQLGSMSGNEGLTLLSTEKEWRPLIHASYADAITKAKTVMWNQKNLTVKGVSPGANTARQLTLRVQADPAMTVGMSYSGIAQLGEQTGLVIPRQSLIIKDALYAVMTVVNNKVVRVPVTVGATANGYTVVQGLPKTARVITKGMNFVNHGDTVVEVKE